MYPAPATSNDANPGTEPSAPTISSAILRGSLAQLAGQLKRERRGVLAESQLRRLLEHDGLDFDLIKAAKHRAEALLQLLLLFEIHARTTNRG